jgi:hypothetical protein
VGGVELGDEAVTGDDAFAVLDPQDLSIGGESLVQPDVLPAQNADRVPEPLVRQFVGDRRFIPLQFVRGQIAITQQGNFAKDRDGLRLQGEEEGRANHHAAG